MYTSQIVENLKATAREEARKAMDDFITWAVLVGPTVSVPIAVMYDHYLNWCARAKNTAPELNRAWFGRRLREQVPQIQVKRVKRKMCYVGVCPG
jgi:hypothetical protein